MRQGYKLSLPGFGHGAFAAFRQPGAAATNENDFGHDREGYLFGSLGSDIETNGRVDAVK